MKNLIFGIILALTLAGCSAAQNGDHQNDTSSNEDKFTYGQVVYVIPDCIPVIALDKHYNNIWHVESFGQDQWMPIQEKYLSDKCPSKN